MKDKIVITCISTILTIGFFSFLGLKTNENPLNIMQSTEVPVGTIMAWSGNPAFLPDNWKVCDGLTMAKDQYPELYRVIADNWTPDHGVNKDLFRIPDLRGLFLRGVSGSRIDEFTDPERNSRLVLGNNRSNEVGSFQRQSVKLPNNSFIGKTKASGSHTHNLPGQAGGKGVEHGTGSRENVTFGDNVHPRSNIHLSANDHHHDFTVDGGGDIETRPINAYVHWIIKVK